MQKSQSQINLIQDAPVSLKTAISILRANMTANKHTYIMTKFDCVYADTMECTVRYTLWPCVLHFVYVVNYVSLTLYFCFKLH